MDEDQERQILRRIAEKEGNREEESKWLIRCIKKTLIVETIRAGWFFLFMTVGGWVWGTHMPESFKKFIADWFQK